MSSNYEWQKHQANERVQARLHEADEHRRAKEYNNNNEFGFKVWLLFPALIGIIVFIILLNG